MTKLECDPTLYIFVRSDLDSMNPGRTAAQSSHAANAMVYKIQKEKSTHFRQLFTKWEKQSSYGFGRCIVLDVGDEFDLECIIDVINNANPFALTDIILDPTYPIKDGRFIHKVPVCTCGYAFFDRSNNELRNIIESLDLYE